MNKLFQGVRNLLLAALVLVCIVCATEVGVRAMRCYRAMEPAGQTGEAGIVLPARETLFELRPLVSLNREDPDTGDILEFRTNSFGLRGPEIALPKPGGVFRILCLGDETTLAADVDEDQTYCRQLQRLLQPLTELQVEVVNAGLPGGCPLTCELLLRHRLLGTQPDLILLHCDDSDTADDRLARRFTRVDADGVPLAAVHPLAATRTAAPLTRLFDEFAVLDLARNRLVDGLDGRGGGDRRLTRVSLTRPRMLDQDLGEISAVDIDQALAPLPEMQKLAAGIYCEFLVSWCPTSASGTVVAEADTGGQRTRPVSSEQRSGLSLDSRLVDVAQEHGIACVNAAADFGPGERELYAADGSTLSPAGHARYAHALARMIYERVPGVWTRQALPAESPEVPPLPGVARGPREQLQ